MNKFVKILLGTLAGVIIVGTILKQSGVISKIHDDNEIDKMAEAYKMEADKIKEMMGEEEKNSIMKDLAVTKAAEFIVANIA